MQRTTAPDEPSGAVFEVVARFAMAESILDCSFLKRNLRKL